MEKEGSEKVSERKAVEMQLQDSANKSHSVLQINEKAAEPCRPFRLINKKSAMCLTFGPEIQCRPLLQSNIKQLWISENVTEDFCSLISFGTGTALTWNGNSVSCEKNRTRSNQLWSFEFAYEQKISHDKFDEGQKKSCKKYFWLTNQTVNDQYLFGSTTSNRVRFTKYDRTLSTSLWQVEEVDPKDKKFGFSEIMSVSSQMYIEAPLGAPNSESDLSDLVQTRFHGKGTQKWVIQKFFQNYVLRALCSGLVLTASQQSVRDNSTLLSLLTGQIKNCKKIVQSVFDNSARQKWDLIKVGPEEFYIQSSTDSDKFLASLSSKDGENIYLVGPEHFGEKNKNICWKVSGALPQGLSLQKKEGV